MRDGSTRGPAVLDFFGGEAIISEFFIANERPGFRHPGAERSSSSPVERRETGRIETHAQVNNPGKGVLLYARVRNPGAPSAPGYESRRDQRRSGLRPGRTICPALMCGLGNIPSPSLDQQHSG